MLEEVLPTSAPGAPDDGLLVLGVEAPGEALEELTPERPLPDDVPPDELLPDEEPLSVGSPAEPSPDDPSPGELLPNEELLPEDVSPDEPDEASPPDEPSPSDEPFPPDEPFPSEEELSEDVSPGDPFPDNASPVAMPLPSFPLESLGPEAPSPSGAELLSELTSALSMAARIAGSIQTVSEFPSATTALMVTEDRSEDASSETNPDLASSLLR